MLSENPPYFFSKNARNTPVILLPRITIVSGHMINGDIVCSDLFEIWRLFWFQNY